MKTVLKILLVCFVTIPMTDSILTYKNTLFRSVNRIATSRSRWLLTLVHDLRPYLKFLENLSNDIGRTLWTVDNIIANYYTQDNSSSEYGLTFEKMKVEIISLRLEIENLLKGTEEYKDLSISKRQKRSLLPFVGRAFSWLFGTVSSSDLDKIRGNINQLASNQKAISHVVSESLSILNVSRLQISNNRNQINALSDGLRKLDLKLENIVAQFKKQILKLEGFTHLFLRTKLVLDDIKLMLLDAISYSKNTKILLSMLTLGHLGPSVIIPEKLRQLLLEIQDKLPPSVKLPANPKTNLWHYYKILTCVSLIEDYKIIIILNIPLLDNDDHYIIYKVHSLPVPMTTDHILSKSKGTSRFVARYKLETTTLAVSVDSTKYALITDNESKQCTNPVMNFCRIKSPIFPINLSELCVMALFSKNKEKTSSRCDISVKPNEILPTSEYFTNGYWAVIVRKQARFSIVCQDTHLEHSSIVVKPPIQIIRLKPTCKAVNDHVTLPSHNTNESTYFDDTSFKHLLINFNESITDIWKPITDPFGNYTLTKLPPKLKGTETIPIEKLASELDDLHLKNTTWPSWAWAILCSASVVGVLILYIVFKLYIRPFMKKFEFPCNRSDKKGESSGKVSTDRVPEMIPMVHMKEPSAPDSNQLYPEISGGHALHSLLTLARQQRASQEAETKM